MKKVYVLDMGYMSADENSLVFNKVLAHRCCPNPMHNWVRLPQLAFLIETDDGYLLYDCGPSSKAMEGRWSNLIQDYFPLTQEPNQTFENQLALCGVKPTDIKTVVISHMHQDHYGNIEFLTHADVYVPKEDFMEAQTLVHLSPDRNTHGGYVREDLDIYVKEYHLVDEDFEIAPGIEVICLPGHTPGLLGLVVHADNGTYIFPSDAIYTTEIFGPPAKLSGTFVDSVAFMKSVEKVRKIAKKHNAMVICSHDINQYNTLKLAPEYYD